MGATHARTRTRSDAHCSGAGRRGVHGSVPGLQPGRRREQLGARRRTPKGRPGTSASPTSRTSENRRAADAGPQRRAERRKRARRDPLAAYGLDAPSSKAGPYARVTCRAFPGAAPSGLFALVRALADRAAHFWIFARVRGGGKARPEARPRIRRLGNDVVSSGRRTSTGTGTLSPPPRLARTRRQAHRDRFPLRASSSPKASRREAHRPRAHSAHPRRTSSSALRGRKGVPNDDRR
jgi:hypothetical protein